MSARPDLAELQDPGRDLLPSLEGKGVDSSAKLGIGSRGDLHQGPARWLDLSAVPEIRTGNLLLNFDANATATTADEVEEVTAGRATTGHPRC